MTSKRQNVGERSKKVFLSFRKCFNLNDYQFKTAIVIGQHMSTMVTTNQKPTIDTQKLERTEHKHTTKENHQTTSEETKRRRNEQGRITKTTRKQLIKWQ